ncbi:hypothetical protein GH733_002060 [Mirounga leonina]|nr:hypothetical protein GH733_002060 [Mirounga leonina]
MVTPQEAKGLHLPCDSADFFTCEVIRCHQERLEEPDADHSNPVRSLIPASPTYEKLKEELEGAVPRVPQSSAPMGTTMTDIRSETSMPNHMSPPSAGHRAASHKDNSGAGGNIMTFVRTFQRSWAPELSCIAVLSPVMALEAHALLSAPVKRDPEAGRN